MKDEHDLVMTTEQEVAYKQRVTDDVDDAMIFDYDLVLDTIANSARCEQAIKNLCMLPKGSFVGLNAREHLARAMYADDLITAIADDMRSYFE